MDFLKGATSDAALSAEDAAALLDKIIDEGVREDRDLGPLGDLVAAHRDVFDPETSCLMDRHMSLIRLLVNYHQTPLGPFVNSVREKLKTYCWLTFAARLAHRMDEVEDDVFPTVNLFAQTSRLVPSNVIFSVDNLPQAVVEEAIGKLSSLKLYNRRTDLNEKLRNACGHLIDGHKMREFLWMLKIIDRPKLTDSEGQFLLGAKLCMSLLERSQRLGNKIRQMIV